MATDIGIAIASLKTAYDITRAMKDIHDATKIQGTVFELQRVIMEAQASAIDAREAHSAQIDEIRALKEEIAKLKAWDGEKQRYELKTIGTGAFVYSPKVGMESGEPPHWLCANCYQKGKKVLLQEFARSPDDHSRILWKCPDCSAMVQAHFTRSPAKPEA